MVRLRASIGKANDSDVHILPLINRLCIYSLLKSFRKVEDSHLFALRWVGDFTIVTADRLRASGAVQVVLD